MLLPLYWKHLLVRTRLEGLAKSVQHTLAGLKVLRHPGLGEVYREDGRIDRVLRALVRPDSNCIDVGAHLGSTLSTFTRLAPRGRHWAFEPLPQKADWLRRKFPEVEVRQLALSDARGQVTF
ncbi:MAG TPA: FkbM family methyltransferase, partial [Gemmataceae bacterium]|nr:FkbM family methyltransferase [Gemmataceae bacterium]